MPFPVQSAQDAIDVANAFRNRGDTEYNYVTVSESAKVVFYENREKQLAASQSQDYKVFRLRYTDASGAVFIDTNGNAFISTTSNVEQ